MRTVVEYWNNVVLEIVRRDFSKPSGGKPDQNGPTRTSRALAMIHLAMYDSYFGIMGKKKPYLLLRNHSNFPVPKPNADPIVAVSAAAALVTEALYPSFAHDIHLAFAGFAVVNPSQAAIDDGHEFGMLIANAILAVRSADSSDITMIYSGSPAYGRHREDPYNPEQGFLDPWWGKVDRFASNRAQMSAPPGHQVGDHMANAKYKADYLEVLDLGERFSAGRTAEQRAIGYYWGYDGAVGIGVPPRLYNQIARAWLDQHHPGDVEAQLCVLTMANVAMADVGIDAWHYKYTFNLWRPVVGIREAASSMGPSGIASGSATDTAGGAYGNPAWAPLGLPKTNESVLHQFSLTPPFPAYPSGHASFGAAMFQVLNLFAGNQPLTVEQVIDVENGNEVASGNEHFSFVSDELNGRSIDADGSVRAQHRREYKSFVRPIWENAISRVYIGVHWRFDGMPRKKGDRYGGVPIGLDVGIDVTKFFSGNLSLPNIV